MIVYGVAEFLPGDTSAGEDLRWRIIRRYYADEAVARRAQARDPEDLVYLVLEKVSPLVPMRFQQDLVDPGKGLRPEIRLAHPIGPPSSRGAARGRTSRPATLSPRPGSVNAPGGADRELRPGKPG